MSFEVHAQGAVHVFDCFSCAIHRMAPICEHCRVQIIGQGVEVEGHWYCGGALRPRGGEGGHRRQGVSRAATRSVRRPAGDTPRPGPMTAAGTVEGVYRFLLSRQWVILTLIALVLIPTMIKLGFWQLHRHEHRVAQNQLIAEACDAKPVPVDEAHLPRAHRPARRRTAAVTATGTLRHRARGRRPPPHQRRRPRSASTS